MVNEYGKRLNPGSVDYRASYIRKTNTAKGKWLEALIKSRSPAIFYSFDYKSLPLTWLSNANLICQKHHCVCHFTEEIKPKKLEYSQMKVLDKQIPDTYAKASVKR